MRWCDLAFLHWPVPAEVLRPLIPEPLTLDTFEGTAWLGVVPFRMEDTRYRWAPPVPTATTFPEVNVRTYVRAGDRAGVWFFSLDAGSRMAVWGARGALNLPYFHASMQMARSRDEVWYRSSRTSSPALFEATYGPTAEVFQSQVGTLEHWLTERYCLFGQWHNGLLYALDIHHLPWPLQPGTVQIKKNSLAEAAGIGLPNAAPLVHFAERLDVVAWHPGLLRTDRPQKSMYIGSNH
jgi:uncharacterized protein